MPQEKSKQAAPFFPWPPPMGVTLGVLSLLYILCIHYYFVGYFGDDALFIVMAQSLWQGRYDAIYTPRWVPLTYPVPGYPIFLMPFVKLFAPNWIVLQIISLFLTVLSVALLWRLLKEWFSPCESFFIVLLYAINSLVLRMSGTVMAEPLYLVCLLRVIAGLRQLHSTPRSQAWKEGLWLGAASLLRPHAIVLLPLVVFLYRRSLSWKERSQIIAPALLGLGIFAWRNKRVATSASTVGFVSMLVSGLSNFWHHPAHLQSHLWRLTYEIMVHTLLSISLPSQGWGVPVGFIAIALSSGLTVFGFLRSLKQNPQTRAVILALGGFCLLNFFVLCLWPAIDDRYTLPLLPFLLAFLVKGGIEVAHDFRAWRLPLLVVGGVLLIRGGYEASRTVQEALSAQRPSYRRLPAESLEWVKTHTPKEAVLLGDGALLYLYTERHAWDVMPADDVRDFHQKLRDNGVQYIFLQFLPMLNVPKQEAGPRIDRAGPWLFKEPGYFPVAYENRYEGVCIFNVSP